MHVQMLQYLTFNMLWLWQEGRYRTLKSTQRGRPGTCPSLKWGRCANACLRWMHPARVITGPHLHPSSFSKHSLKVYLFVYRFSPVTNMVQRMCWERKERRSPSLPRPLSLMVAERHFLSSTRPTGVWHHQRAADTHLMLAHMRQPATGGVTSGTGAQ